MNSPSTIGRVAIMCASCLGVMVFADESGPKTAPPPWPPEVKTRTLVSRPDLIEISIQLPRPQAIATTAGGVSGDRIEIPGATGYTSDVEAELPIIRQFVAIPNCDRVDLRVEVSRVETTAGVSVRPPSMTVGGSDPALPERPGVPRGWARVVGIQHARGQALALIEIYPVRYDRGKREISCPREIRLQLKPVNPRGPVAVNTGPLQSALSAVVPNLRDPDGASVPAGPGQRAMHTTGQVCWVDTGDDDWEDAAEYVNTNCAADYLIIVADELLTDAADSSLVEQLATKRAEFNGFNVAIMRMGQIDSTPDNTTTPELMRNLVEAIYDAGTAGHMGDEQLGFLLLLGDALNPNGDIILPTQYQNVSNYKDENLNGADAYFVLLDGDTDIVPDVLVGRLTVDADESDWELENVVTKVTAYEPISASAVWTNKILLMSGGSDANFTFHGEGLTGFQGYFDAIENLAQGGGQIFEKMHRLSPGGTDLLFSQEVCDSIAAGFAVVGLFDHANPVNFENAFFPIHYDTLQNDNSPSLVLSFGSHSGFFDYLGCESGCCYPSPEFPAEVRAGALDSLVVEGPFAVLGNEDDSVRVGIDEFASPGSRWGGFLYDNGSTRGNVRYAVLTDALAGFDHASPLKISGSRISGLSATAIVSADSLWLLDSQVSGTGGNGVELGLGVVATIERSVIEDIDGSGVVCDSCSAQSKIRDSTIRGAGVHGAYLQRVHGFLVDSSVFEDNASAGIRFESADGLVTQSRMEGNAGGVVCLDYSSPVIKESKIDQNGGGVTAAESSYPVVGYGSIGGSNCVTNSAAYHVSNLSAGTIYARHDYWGSICCKASKFFGNVSCDSCETSSICEGAAAPVVLSLAEPASGPTLPEALDLVSAAPNPFNPTVRIRFAVPAGGARVQLVIYNVRGQRVAVLEDGTVPPGYHERVWNGIDTHGGPVASGIYFAQMRSAGFQKAMKIVLLK